MISGTFLDFNLKIADLVKNHGIWGEFWNIYEAHRNLLIQPKYEFRDFPNKA